ncbi:MAG: pseudouridine synthase [Clostridium sp.]|nr:pseudouridine synthase [Clostridium sp.]
MRINKLLSNYGICSRKETRKLIEDGRIIVNGKLCIQGQWVEETDDILLDNKKLEPKKKIYLAFNKPKGIICTRAGRVKDNIKDYLNYPDYIFPVGRLDKESQGLILLTNDGEMANSILEADNMHEKEYLVRVDKDFDNEFIENMSKGVEILNTVTRPCIVERIDERSFKIILTQGLNRQIRRMCKAFGYNVIFLKRIRILNIRVEGIEEGEWRELSQEEIDFLKTMKFE